MLGLPTDGRISDQVERLRSELSLTTLPHRYSAANFFTGPSEDKARDQILRYFDESRLALLGQLRRCLDDSTGPTQRKAWLESLPHSIGVRHSIIMSHKPPIALVSELFDIPERIITENDGAFPQPPLIATLNRSGFACYAQTAVEIVRHWRGLFEYLYHAAVFLNARHVRLGAWPRFINTHHVAIITAGTTSDPALLQQALDTLDLFSRACDCDNSPRLTDDPLEVITNVLAATSELNSLMLREVDDDDDSTAWSPRIESMCFGTCVTCDHCKERSFPGGQEPFLFLKEEHATGPDPDLLSMTAAALDMQEKRTTECARCNLACNAADAASAADSRSPEGLLRMMATVSTAASLYSFKRGCQLVIVAPLICKSDDTDDRIPSSAVGACNTISLRPPGEFFLSGGHFRRIFTARHSANHHDFILGHDAVMAPDSRATFVIYVCDSLDASVPPASSATLDINFPALPSRSFPPSPTPYAAPPHFTTSPTIAAPAASPIAAPTKMPPQREVAAGPPAAAQPAPPPSCPAAPVKFAGPLGPATCAPASAPTSSHGASRPAPPHDFTHPSRRSNFTEATPPPPPSLCPAAPSKFACLQGPAAGAPATSPQRDFTHASRRPNIPTGPLPATPSTPLPRTPPPPPHPAPVRASNLDVIVVDAPAPAASGATSSSLCPTAVASALVEAEHCSVHRRGNHSDKDCRRRGKAADRMDVTPVAPRSRTAMDAMRVAEAARSVSAALTTPAASSRRTRSSASAPLSPPRSPSKVISCPSGSSSAVVLPTATPERCKAHLRGNHSDADCSRHRRNPDRMDDGTPDSRRAVSRAKSSQAAASAVGPTSAVSTATAPPARASPSPLDDTDGGGPFTLVMSKSARRAATAAAAAPPSASLSRLQRSPAAAASSPPPTPSTQHASSPARFPIHIFPHLATTPPTAATPQRLSRVQRELFPGTPRTFNIFPSPATPAVRQDATPNAPVAAPSPHGPVTVTQAGVPSAVSGAAASVMARVDKRIWPDRLMCHVVDTCGGTVCGIRHAASKEGKATFFSHVSQHLLRHTGDVEALKLQMDLASYAPKPVKTKSSKARRHATSPAAAATRERSAPALGKKPLGGVNFGLLMAAPSDAARRAAIRPAITVLAGLDIELVEGRIAAAQQHATLQSTAPTYGAVAPFAALIGTLCDAIAHAAEGGNLDDARNHRRAFDLIGTLILGCVVDHSDEGDGTAFNATSANMRARLTERRVQRFVDGDVQGLVDDSIAALEHCARRTESPAGVSQDTADRRGAAARRRAAQLVRDGDYSKAARALEHAFAEAEAPMSGTAPQQHADGDSLLDAFERKLAPRRDSAEATAAIGRYDHRDDMPQPPAASGARHPTSAALRHPAPAARAPPDAVPPDGGDPPLTTATAASPAVTPPPAPAPAGSRGSDISDEHLRDCIKDGLKKHRAAGRSGHRNDTFRCLLSSRLKDAFACDAALRGVARVCTFYLDNPDSVETIAAVQQWAEGRGVALRKPDTANGAVDVRPLVMGEPFLKLLEILALNSPGTKERIRDGATAHQRGVFQANGAESIVAAASAFLARHPNAVVIGSDAENAYQALSQEAVEFEIGSAPIAGSRFANLARTSMRANPRIYARAGGTARTLRSLEGVRQGDPLSSALFALVLGRVIRRTCRQASLIGLVQGVDFMVLAYADDFYVLGNGEAVARAIHRIYAAALLDIANVRVNWSKLRVYAAPAGSEAHRHERAMTALRGFPPLDVSDDESQWVAFTANACDDREPPLQHDGLVICGTPIGDRAFTESSIMRKLVKHATAVSTATSFMHEYAHEGFSYARLSICARLQHLCRTVRPSWLLPILSVIPEDTHRRLLAAILAVPADEQFESHTLLTAARAIRQGGLGLRVARDVAHAAYAAAHLETICSGLPSMLGADDARTGALGPDDEVHAYIPELREALEWIYSRGGALRRSAADTQGSVDGELEQAPRTFDVESLATQLAQSGLTEAANRASRLAAATEVVPIDELLRDPGAACSRGGLSAPDGGPEAAPVRAAHLQHRFTVGMDATAAEILSRQLDGELQQLRASHIEAPGTSTAELECHYVADVTLCLRIAVLKEASAPGASCRLALSLPATDALHLSNSALRAHICKIITKTLPQMRGAMPGQLCDASAHALGTKCGAEAGPTGLHASQCRFGGGHTKRHDVLAVSIAAMHTACGNGVTLEWPNLSNGTKPPSAPRGDRDAPASRWHAAGSITPDITVRNGSGARHIDVTTVDPLAASALGTPSSVLIPAKVAAKMAGTYQQTWVYTDVNNIDIRVMTSMGSMCPALRADIRAAGALSVSRGRWDDAAAFERFYTRKIVYDFLNAMGDTIDAASDRFFGSMTRATVHPTARAADPDEPRPGSRCSDATNTPGSRCPDSAAWVCRSE